MTTSDVTYAPGGCSCLITNRVEPSAASGSAAPPMRTRRPQPRQHPARGPLVSGTVDVCPPSSCCHAKLTLLLSGSSRTRFPVRAKMAFASAGAAGGTGGSPIPRTSLPSSNPLTMISGV
jgi:hypothetical protein